MHRRAGLPCGLLLTIHTLRKRVSSCTDAVPKVEQKCTASCCSGRFRAMLRQTYGNTLSGTRKMVGWFKSFLSVRWSTLRFKASRPRPSVMRPRIFLHCRLSRICYQSPLYLPYIKKSRQFPVGYMQLRLHDRRCKTRLVAHKRRH